MTLESIIGLEIHVQLKTKSKMFCACDNTGEDKPANTTICPICLGHPGTLPVPNAEAIKMAAQAALALNLRVNLHSKFDRKNYFYPDLPKGYQISQYDEPLASDGFLTIEVGEGQKQIGIERLHLEEDTAKLFHQGSKSLIDFNRAGTPLIEIVTRPDIRTPQEAKIFLQELRLIMRYIGVADADMEKGHLRCDANISLRPDGETKLYPKTEIKNLNSFRSVERALLYEIKRQTLLWQTDQAPDKTTTRGWDEVNGETVPQREKEAVHDYRYFPEPDIPPLQLTVEQVESWRADLPELPAYRRHRWQSHYGLKAAEARLLTEDKDLGDYAERVIIDLAAELDSSPETVAKLAVNWLVNKLSAIMMEKKITLKDLPFSEADFVQFLLLVSRRQVNSTNAQLLLRRMVETGRSPEVIISEEDLAQSGVVDDWPEVIKLIINSHPQQVEEYRGGKTALLKYFVGLVMRQTKGKVDPLEAESELKRQLDKQ